MSGLRARVVLTGFLPSLLSDDLLLPRGKNVLPSEDGGAAADEGEPAAPTNDGEARADGDPEGDEAEGK